MVPDPLALAEDEGLSRAVAYAAFSDHAPGQFFGSGAGGGVVSAFGREVLPDADLLWHNGHVYAYVLCAVYCLRLLSHPSQQGALAGLEF